MGDGDLVLEAGGADALRTEIADAPQRVALPVVGPVAGHGHPLIDDHVERLHRAHVSGQQGIVDVGGATGQQSRVQALDMIAEIAQIRDQIGAAPLLIGVHPHQRRVVTVKPVEFGGDGPDLAEVLPVIGVAGHVPGDRQHHRKSHPVGVGEYRLHQVLGRTGRDVGPADLRGIKSLPVVDQRVGDQEIPADPLELPQVFEDVLLRPLRVDDSGDEKIDEYLSEQKRPLADGRGLRESPVQA